MANKQTASSQVAKFNKQLGNVRHNLRIARKHLRYAERNLQTAAGLFAFDDSEEAIAAVQRAIAAQDVADQIAFDTRAELHRQFQLPY